MTKKTTNGYGHLRMGDGSLPKFIIHEDVVHKVRLVSIGNGGCSIRCSRRGCKFRIDGIATLDEANDLASKHIASAALRDKKKK